MDCRQVVLCSSCCGCRKEKRAGIPCSGLTWRNAARYVCMKPKWLHQPA